MTRAHNDLDPPNKAIVPYAAVEKWRTIGTIAIGQDEAWPVILLHVESYHDLNSPLALALLTVLGSRISTPSLWSPQVLKYRCVVTWFTNKKFRKRPQKLRPAMTEEEAWFHYVNIYVDMECWRYTRHTRGESRFRKKLLILLEESIRFTEEFRVWWWWRWFEKER